MIHENMKPSEIFLGLWRQWARTDKSGVEDFAVCAEAWAEIRRMEDHAEKSRAEFDDARRRIMDGFQPGPIHIVAADPAPIPSFWTEKDAGGASPSPTETEERGPSGTPAPTEDAEGVQSGPEAEPDPTAVKKGPWRHRRERVQKRLLATKFSTQAIVDKSGREVTVGDVRTFADDCDALPARKVGAIEDALNALEGTV